MEQTKTLYITDLDGTLFRSDKTLSAHTASVINKRIGEGMLFSAASARSLMGIFMIPLHEIHFTIPLVLMNGVLLYDYARREILDTCEMPPETVGAVLNICAAQGKYPFVYRIEKGEMDIAYRSATSEGERVFLKERSEHFPGYFHACETYDFNRGAVYFSLQDTYERLLPIRDGIEALPQTNCVLYQDTYLQGNYYLEIFSSGAGKDNGLLRLKDRVGADRVVAFGDNLNDLPMLRQADVACVVRNGAPGALQAADIVLPSNDEDGVAAYLEKEWPLCSK